MTKNTKLVKLTPENINEWLDKMVRVHFRDSDHLPIYGKFVALEDHEFMLANKKMVRFVSFSKCEGFDKANKVIKSQYTRLFYLGNLNKIAYEANSSSTSAV